jgi:hypothetical protein
MEISSPVPNPKVVLSYNLQKPNISAKIICDAVRLLDLWNVMIPNISHQMADSPFCHVSSKTPNEMGGFAPPILDEKQ